MSIMLMIKSHKRTPTHEQVTFTRLKQMLFLVFLPDIDTLQSAQMMMMIDDYI